MWLSNNSINESFLIPSMKSHLQKDGPVDMPIFGELRENGIFIVVGVPLEVLERWAVSELLVDADGDGGWWLFTDDQLDGFFGPEKVTEKLKFT